MKKLTHILLFVLILPMLSFAQDSVKTLPFLEDPTISLIIMNLLVAAIVVIILLSLKVRKRPVKKVFVGDQEFTKLLKDYKSLKNEYDELKATYAQDKSDIEKLSYKIKSLEKANVELAEQKEKMLENQNSLLDLQKQKEDLFAIAIHDIKNPISAIKGYVQLLEDYDLNATEQQEIVKHLVSSTDRILDLAYEMNKVVVEREKKEESEAEFVEEEKSTNIYDVIKSVVSQNQAYADTKKIMLNNNSSPKTPKAFISFTKLEEVLFNLINNAIKYSPENTVVQVKSYFNRENITIEVVDNGVGLPKEDLKSAFTKGGILSAKPTGGEKSTGLGLWIVKKIVEEHNGKVWVDSKLHIGSTFGFQIPHDGNVDDLIHKSDED